MTKKVILYFETPTDALRFTLAAGSVMAGEARVDNLVHEMQRASRIQLGTTATAEPSAVPPGSELITN